jgi:hypothetical protein
MIDGSTGTDFSIAGGTAPIARRMDSRTSSGFITDWDMT